MTPCHRGVCLRWRERKSDWLKQKPASSHLHSEKQAKIETMQIKPPNPLKCSYIESFDNLAEAVWVTMLVRSWRCLCSACSKSYNLAPSAATKSRWEKQWAKTKRIQKNVHTWNTIRQSHHHWVGFVFKYWGNKKEKGRKLKLEMSLSHLIRRNESRNLKSRLRKKEKKEKKNSTKKYGFFFNLGHETISGGNEAPLKFSSQLSKKMWSNTTKNRFSVWQIHVTERNWGPPKQHSLTRVSC